jgi:putative phosphoesterase
MSDNPPIRIGIVSDTHGQSRFTLEAIRLLESLEVAQVIHCGDVGSPDLVRLFQTWPTHFVLGNVDREASRYRRVAEESGNRLWDRFGELELAGRRIAFLHGDDGMRLRETIQSGDYDVVCHGHTHLPEIRRVGTTMVLNPGALYRAKAHTIATLELPELVATHFTV